MKGFEREKVETAENSPKQDDSSHKMAASQFNSQMAEMEAPSAVPAKREMKRSPNRLIVDENTDDDNSIAKMTTRWVYVRACTF